jgi:CheY-like chemotaxis protein
MQPKTVAIVEDEDDQREALQMTLAGMGFRAVGAATVAEANQLIKELGDELDVLMMDMKLDDPDAPLTTGADVAIEYRKRHSGWNPEFLIKTAYPNEVNYYRLAQRLGVAAYLTGDEATYEDFVRHIRALALKRSLRVERPRVIKALTSVSDSAQNLSEAVSKFCRETLADEMDACLCAPYMLLLTDEQGTQNVATNTDIPTGYTPLYGDIQTVAHGIKRFASAYVPWERDMGSLPAPRGEAEREVLSRLVGGALLPLASVKNFRLTLALFPTFADESGYRDDVGKFAAVLAQHVRPGIIEHFLGILTHLDSWKRAMLKSISSLCHYIGQEQQRLLEGGVALGHLKEESGTHRSFRLMADDLRQTATALSAAAGQRKDAATILEMRRLIEQEFKSLRETADTCSATIALRVEGSCRVRAGEDLRIAVKRLLQWLAQRSAETPLGVTPGIFVTCAEQEGGPSVTFEDRSRRLPREVREHLFEPFSTSLALPAESGSGPGVYLPLYLSKVLVEEKYGGRLQDETGRASDEVGIRLVMRFAPLGEAAGAADVA